MPVITRKPDGILLRIYVQPKSSSNAVVGIHDDALKVRLTAPPVDGAANQLCIKFLAKTFGIPKSSMEIVSGHTSRLKQLFIHLPDAVNSSHPDPSANIINKIENMLYLKKP